MSSHFVELTKEQRGIIVCALQVYSEKLERIEMFSRSDATDELRNVILDADNVCVYKEEPNDCW